MDELILHHYEGSPFAEKIRGILGYKGLDWGSCAVSPILPRPWLAPLVGAHRRTPVLQRGADVYCDTRCIAAALDRAFPSPPLLPPGSVALSHAITRWVEPRTFVAMAALRFRSPETLEGFVGSEMSGAQFAADRAPFMRGALDVARLRELEPASHDQVQAFLSLLGSALSESGGPFLTGPRPALADFASSHLVWWLDRAPRIAEVLEAVPRVLEWHTRLRSFGHGRPKPISGAEALQHARDAASGPLERAGLGTDRYGRGPGRRVRVRADDYGRDAVEGELLHQDADEIVIQRDAESVGRVRVHFPRIGFEILPI